MEKTPGTLHKIAMLGRGNSGKNHIRTAHAPGAFAALHYANSDLAARFAADTGAKAPGWQAILADKSIDGVILATPAGPRAVLARAVLDVGKHVVVEKPLAFSPNDANEVVAHAKRVGWIVRTGEKHREVGTDKLEIEK